MEKIIRLVTELISKDVDFKYYIYDEKTTVAFDINGFCFWVDFSRDSKEFIQCVTEKKVLTNFESVFCEIENIYWKEN